MAQPLNPVPSRIETLELTDEELNQAEQGEEQPGDNKNMKAVSERLGVSQAEVQELLQAIAPHAKAPAIIWLSMTLFTLLFGWTYLFAVFWVLALYRVLISRRPEEHADQKQRLV